MTPTPRISQFYNERRPLSPQCRQALDDLAEDVSYPAGRRLLQAGQVCDHLFIIREGVARVFGSESSKAVTSQLLCEGDVVAEPKSLFTRQPSAYSIELLDASSLIKINYRRIESLYARFHELEASARLLAIDCYLEASDRSRTFQRLRAKDRYLRFITERPTLLQRVKLGHIASYLGVSQVQLSRIRSELRGSSPHRSQF